MGDFNMVTDWLWGLAGGLMIGTAAATYLLVNGRVMGASGILGELVDGSGRGTSAERLSFIAGLIAVPALMTAGGWAAQTNLTGSFVIIVAAGVLTGIGTRLAGGCTSGHGVCGISRLSVRGIAATIIYIAAGVVVVTALRWAGVVQ